PSYHVLAVGSLIELAETSLHGGDADRTRTLLERADRHLAVALKFEPEGYRFQRQRSLALRGQLQARAGDLRPADATAGEMESIPRQGIEHFNVCSFLGGVVSAVRQSAAPEAERNLLAQALTDRAFVQLQKAIAAGYRNLAMISSQEFLQDRADYKQL